MFEYGGDILCPQQHNTPSCFSGLGGRLAYEFRGKRYLRVSLTRDERGAYAVMRATVDIDAHLVTKHDGRVVDILANW